MPHEFTEVTPVVVERMRGRVYFGECWVMAGRIGSLPRRLAKAVLPRSAVTAIHRRMVTQAARREMDRPEVLHEFWRQPAPAHNSPHDYIGHVARSQALLELIGELPTEASILEVGCNVGRNLAYLHDHGYRQLEGVEISPHAVALLRRTYPQLADVPIHLGPAEEVLPTLPDDGYDLVFTMAVLEHIHPDSSMVFDELVRVGRSVLAIEPPGRSSHREFPHDIPQIFQSRGLHLVSSRPMKDFPNLAGDKSIAFFIAHRFRRPE